MTTSETKEEENTDKKTGTSAIVWSSVRACVFLAAAIAFITELLRPVWRRDP